MTKSEGEQLFYDSFQVKTNLFMNNEEFIKDCMYKFSHNLSTAIELRYIARGIYFTKKDYSAHSFTYMITFTVLTSLCLQFRKITDESRDKTSRSVYNLITHYDSLPDSSGKKSRLKQVTAHYKIINDKYIAHQDSISIHEAWNHFPEDKIMNRDIKFLAKLYNELCDYFFISAPGVELAKPAYYPNIKKITSII